jgi:hypothetical protein
MLHFLSTLVDATSMREQGKKLSLKSPEQHAHPEAFSHWIVARRHRQLSPAADFGSLRRSAAISLKRQAKSRLAGRLVKATSTTLMKLR